MDQHAVSTQLPCFVGAFLCLKFWQVLPIFDLKIKKPFQSPLFCPLFLFWQSTGIDNAMVMYYSLRRFNTGLERHKTVSHWTWRGFLCLNVSTRNHQKLWFLSPCFIPRYLKPCRIIKNFQGTGFVEQANSIWSDLGPDLIFSVPVDWFFILLIGMTLLCIDFNRFFGENRFNWLVVLFIFPLRIKTKILRHFEIIQDDSCKGKFF